CGVMWSLYLLRLRQLGMHIRNRLHERHMERERIARELHDTLLQSIQGLILRFQAAAATIPVDQPSRQAMESALERADEVIAEGRDRVLDLRASSAGDEDLAQAFSRVGEELQLAHTAQFRVIIEGVAKPLDPIVRDELFRIGREALVNACQHAGAQNIEVRITHARSELRLSFGDDGRGIDPAVLEEGGRPGHWGLTGMRERAGRIEADLSVRSHPGAGTQVEVRMKASLAYRPCLEKSRWKWLRNLVGRSR
ncbi:MAG: ATPase, partial [Xanthomonadales bacterium]|nr:ATPase [Xanthomonadales bacterium]MCB1575774.1 ATPase [Xanthomonadales bacterium]